MTTSLPPLLPPPLQSDLATSKSTCLPEIRQLFPLSPKMLEVTTVRPPAWVQHGLPEKIRVSAHTVYTPPPLHHITLTSLSLHPLSPSHHTFPPPSLHTHLPLSFTSHSPPITTPPLHHTSLSPVTPPSPPSHLPPPRASRSRTRVISLRGMSLKASRTLVPSTCRGSVP